MSYEMLFLDQFFTWHPQHPNYPVTALAPYEATAWANTAYPDTGYYRALLHNVVAGACYADYLALDATPLTKVSIPRLVTFWARTIRHYSQGPSGQPGWGYYKPDSNPSRQLSAHSEFMGSPLAIATALLWPHLDPIQRDAAREILRTFADRLLAWRTQDHYRTLQSIDNTMSEEAAACASFLAVMAGFDPHYASAPAWLTRAKLLMTWAYKNSETRRLVPPNDRNQHPTNYQNTLANHNMFPHPLYGFSLLAESAQAALPWAATGRTEHYHTTLAGLYGSDAATAYRTYIANVVFLQGASPQGNLPPNPNLKLKGYTYPANQLSWTGPAPTPIAFADQHYRCPGALTLPGCSDWGMGIEFQNAAFAFASWIDETYYPSLGLAYYNYQKVLASQAARADYGYLPTLYQNGLWRWDYLPTTLGGQQPTDGTRMLINFFLPAATFPPLTLAGQINTHYFLNSLSAYNHAIAWLLRSNYWNPMGVADALTLPNFNQT